jgi:hypothetical protein
MSQVFADDFEAQAAGANPDATNWVEENLGANTSVENGAVGKVLRIPGSGSPGVVRTTTAAHAAQVTGWCEVTVDATANFDGGPLFLYQTATDQFYAFDFYGGTTAEIYRHNGFGTSTLIGSGTAGSALAAGDRLRIERKSDNKFYCYKNGTLVVTSSADTTYTTAGQCGIYAWTPVASGYAKFRDFKVDDGAAGGTNYQVDFALSVTTGLSLAGGAVSAGSLSPSATAGLGQSAGASAAGALAQAATAGLAQSAVATTGAALNPSATAGLTQSAASAAAGSLAVTATAGLTQVAAASAASSLGLSATAGVTYGGSGASLGSVSFSATAGVDQSAAAATGASLGFDSLSSLAFTTGQAIVVELSLDATAGLSVAGNAAGAASVGLGAAAGLGQSASAASLASVGMAATAGLTLGAGAAANVSLSLPASPALALVAASSPGGAVTISGFLVLEQGLSILVFDVNG